MNIIKMPVNPLNMSAQQALQSALDEVEFEDVLIIGYDKQGELLVRSSRLTCAEALFLANKACRYAENGGNTGETR